MGHNIQYRLIGGSWHFVFHELTVIAAPPDLYFEDAWIHIHIIGIDNKK
jgi:hypothetical protein